MNIHKSFLSRLHCCFCNCCSSSRSPSLPFGCFHARSPPQCLCFCSHPDPECTHKCDIVLQSDTKDCCCCCAISYQYFRPLNPFGLSYCTSALLCYILGAHYGGNLFFKKGLISTRNGYVLVIIRICLPCVALCCFTLFCFDLLCLLCLM